MNKTSSPPIIRTDNNPQKTFFSSLKLSLIMVVLGIFSIAIGQKFQENLTYFSEDYEELFASGMVFVGMLLLLMAVVLPFFNRKIAQKTVLVVYSNYIEGSAFQINGNTQTFVNFHETYDKINSVSTNKNNISVNLSDGKTIRCSAYNAEAVASAIRARI